MMHIGKSYISEMYAGYIMFTESENHTTPHTLKLIKSLSSCKGNQRNCSSRQYLSLQYIVKSIPNMHGDDDEESKSQRVLYKMAIRF